MKEPTKGGQEGTVPAEAVTQGEGYIELDAALLPHLSFMEKDDHFEVEETPRGDKS